MLSFVLCAASLLHDIALVTGYVNQSFPQPLNKDEERYYFERWLKGDKKAHDLLVEHNLRLVAHVAKKFDSSGIDQDDLISIGTVGLIKAVDTYQPTKGTKFATYAARCIQNEILKTKGRGRNIHVLKENKSKIETCKFHNLTGIIIEYYDVFDFLLEREVLF